jgi:hypothetical protein
VLDAYTAKKNPTHPDSQKVYVYRIAWSDRFGGGNPPQTPSQPYARLVSFLVNAWITFINNNNRRENQWI